jgi:hypothetical protein
LPTCAIKRVDSRIGEPSVRAADAAASAVTAFGQGRNTCSDLTC